MKNITYIRIHSAFTELVKLDSSPLDKFYIAIQGEHFKAASIHPDRIQLTGKSGCYHVDVLNQTCTCQLPENAVIIKAPSGKEHFADQVKGVLEAQGKKVVILNAVTVTRAKISQANLDNAEIILCDDTHQHGVTPGKSVADLIKEGVCPHLRALNRYILKINKLEALTRLCIKLNKLKGGHQNGGLQNSR